MRLAFWIASTLLVAACSSTGGSDLEARVEELLSQMTLEEKVAQMAGDTGLLLPEGDIAWNVPGV
ncbi:MAG: hypothetical protein JSV06_00925, partial [Myxococcales bacterium]